MPASHPDVLIVGAGAAGLACALLLPEGLRVLVLAKDTPREGATDYAQGGIAASIGPEDHPDQHLSDTLKAGYGLCHPERVARIVARGPALIHWLTELGMDFTADPEATSDPRLHLTREGGHGRRRVAHADDATGSALQKTLLAEAKKRPNIEIRPCSAVARLIGDERCHGAWIYQADGATVYPVYARATVLATGGGAQVYQHSSTPPVATGDGFALARRLGATVANLEFVQFHPTILYDPEGWPFLISEALRGEGAVLQRPDGTPFMAGYHPDAELAPRDAVARAIHSEMKRLGAAHVLLDISHRPAAWIQQRFPTIEAECRRRGWDLTAGPIPVVPAAHYLCGGLVVDAAGRTDVPGLYAAGEVTHTGLHGANRLASNSLLECLTGGEAAAMTLADELVAADRGEPSESPPPVCTGSLAQAEDWRRRLRETLWQQVGIVRRDAELAAAVDSLGSLWAEWQAARPTGAQPDPYQQETGHLIETAWLIAESARRRQESRGLHFNADHPEADPDQAQDTVLTAAESPGSPRALTGALDRAPPVAGS